MEMLGSLTDALLVSDATLATAIYTEASQKFSQQLGSTGVLALKRCLDLVK